MGFQNRIRLKSLTGALILIVVLLTFCSGALASVNIINLSPNRGMVGSAVTITAQGVDITSPQNNTVLINGISAPVLRVYQVTGSEDLYKVLFTVPPNVVPSPITRPITVSVKMEVNGEQSNTLPFILYPSPAIKGISPDTGTQGDSLNIEITTVNVRLIPGMVRLDLGSGIIVNSVSVTSPTTLNAAISIADNAQVGSRDLTIFIGRGMLRKVGAFEVLAAGGQGGGLSLDVNQPPSPVFTRTVNISGAVNAVATGGQPITAPPVFISSLSPSTSAQGKELKVVIEGTNTHFLQGTTQVSFGEGIDVLGLEVNSPNSVVAHIRISNDASIGERRVMAVTGEEEATSVIAFNVLPGTMTIKGRVTDLQGNPLRGAWVSLKGLNIRATTDANGVFTLHNVPSGKQTLVVNAQNFAPLLLDIEGKNGDTLDLSFSDIKLERRAAPPSDPSSANIYSIISHGASSLEPPPGIEEAKQRIINTIIAVGDTDMGVLDEDGHQLNPKITGDGIVSLTSKGLERMAEAWAIQGEVARLTSALILFNSIVGWDPKPPSFEQWIKAFNDFLPTVWQNPTAPGNSLFVAIFNRGAVISNTPPRITPDTTLNPLQMYLLINSFAVYLDKKFFPQSTGSVNTSYMLAELGLEYRDTVSDIDGPILLADEGENNGGGGSGKNKGIKKCWSDVISNFKNLGVGSLENSLIENYFDIYATTSLPEVEKVRAYLMIQGLEKSMQYWETSANLIQGFLSGITGSVLQQIYSPLLQKMKEELVKAGIPHAPAVVGAFTVKTITGINAVLLFKPNPGDHGQNTLPKFYYSIYRIDRNGHIERLISVKPSHYFHRNKEGYLVYVDDSPPLGANIYYFQTHIQRVEGKMPRELDWGNDWVWRALTAGLPAGGFVLNALQDSLNMAYEVFHDTRFQSSGLSSISVIVYPVANNFPSIDIAVDRYHGKEYVSLGLTGIIYEKTPDGWMPVIDTYFKEPHQKGLAIDSQGWLYTVNSASEERFGGRMFGFRHPYDIKPSKDNISHGDRFYLGSVRYGGYVPGLQTWFFARPCDVTDLYVGDFWFFNPKGVNDPESIAILDVGSQAVRILDRRDGNPPGPWPDRNISQPIFKSDENLITPFSRIAQNPVDGGSSYFITSGSNIFYISMTDPSTPEPLFNSSNNRFSMLSDLVFDDLGDLYFLDNQTGKLYLLPRQVLENAQFYSVTVNQDEVIEMPYTFKYPLTIDIGADGNSLLVGDIEGIHRTPLFIPCKTNVDAPVLVEIPGGALKALRQGDYLLLPPFTKTVTIVPANEPERVINLRSLDTLDYQPLNEPNENEPEVKLQHTQDKFTFSVSIPGDAKGKLLLRNLKIPCSRIVLKGQQIDLPGPEVTETLLVPEVNDIRQLIVFSPEEVKADGSSVSIKGIIKDGNVNSIRLTTDSGETRNIDVVNHTFEANITPHSQTTALWLSINRQGQPPLKRRVMLRQSNTPKATLSGVVVDSKTLTPVTRARIYIPEIDTEVYTDLSGYYSVKVPAGQDITLEVSQ